MKTIHILSICLLGIAQISCNEKAFHPVPSNAFVAKDTTYLASIETQQDRVVLVEDATGVKCVNCPDGAEKLSAVQGKYPGRVIIVGEHSGFFATPIKGLSKDSFALSSIELLLNTYFGGDPDRPSAAIDRTLQKIATGEAYFVGDRDSWLFRIEKRLPLKPLMNLSVSSLFRQETNEYYITVRGAYTESTAKKQNLTLMLTQDKIIDAQEKDMEVLKEYEHNHVVREILTDYVGQPILTHLSTIEAGRVFEKTFNYKIPENKTKWIPENMNIIAFVHNNVPAANGVSADKEVQQSAECKLKP